MLLFCRTLLLFGIFTFTLTESRTFQKDLDDLEDVYGLVQRSDIHLRGWTSGTDPCGDIVPCGINHLQDCNWEGVACLKDGDLDRIAGIAIEGRSGRRLTGTLPVRLPEALRSIALPNNDLKGNLFDPECLGAEYRCFDIWWRNSELTQIDLSGNQLRGPLPNWITMMQLQRIQLSNNRLNGSLPIVWKMKPHLNKIDLSNNQLTGTLPDGWSSLIAIQYLLLSRNRLERTIPSGWFRLPALILLDVSGNCAVCGRVPKNDVAIYGNGTNLNTDCANCNGCNCKSRSLNFLAANILVSIAVLSGIMGGWCFYRRFCVRHEDRLPVTDSFPSVMPPKPQINPTIVINPDQDVCICCQVDETPHSSSETEESELDIISEGDSSDYDWDSGTESIDPKVLAFLYKKSPMMALADRTWSAEIAGTSAGPSEIHPEGYISDGDGKSSGASYMQRRSKSALEASSIKNISKDFLESRKSAKRAADLAPTSKRPRNKHRRRKVRTFRRLNRGLGQSTSQSSQPQTTLRLTEELKEALSKMDLPPNNQ